MLELRTDLTAEFVRSILGYDPESGAFTWLVRLDVLKAAQWNGKLAGTSAGTGDKKGYLSFKIQRRRYMAHRIAWLIMTGEWPPADIDHINGDPGDNRWFNLRLATRQENNSNAKRRSDNTSGFKGVRKDHAGPNWIARIRKDGKRHYIGRFPTAAEAHAAYVAAAVYHFGEFARAA